MTEKELEVEQAEIDRGRRMKEVLDDEVVRGAFATIESRYYQDFRKASTDDEIRQAHSKARALEDLCLELRRVFDSGKHAQATRSRREKTR